MIKLKDLLNYLKKFWNYIWHDDSLGSYILHFIFAFVVIKFMLFPVIGFALNNDYPIVAIVSGSMEHKVVYNRVCNVHIADIQSKSLDYDEWWNYCGSYYQSNYNLSKETFSQFEYKNGLNIGDVMILYGKDPQKIEVGEVLVFIPQDKRFFEQKGPVIHRVVQKWTDENGKIHFRTKGDHNPVSIDNFENDIIEDNVIGVSVARVPFIGYAKILLNNAILAIYSIIR